MRSISSLSICLLLTSEKLLPSFSFAQMQVMLSPYQGVRPEVSISRTMYLGLSGIFGGDQGLFPFEMFITSCVFAYYPSFLDMATILVVPVPIIIQGQNSLSDVHFNGLSIIFRRHF